MRIFHIYESFYDVYLDYIRIRPTVTTANSGADPICPRNKQFPDIAQPFIHRLFFLALAELRFIQPASGWQNQRPGAKYNWRG
jgi:hypothetical protein